MAGSLDARSLRPRDTDATLVPVTRLVARSFAAPREPRRSRSRGTRLWTAPRVGARKRLTANPWKADDLGVPSQTVSKLTISGTDPHGRFFSPRGARPSTASAMACRLLPEGTRRAGMRHPIRSIAVSSIAVLALAGSAHALAGCAHQDAPVNGPSGPGDLPAVPIGDGGDAAAFSMSAQGTSAGSEPSTSQSQRAL